MLCCVEVAFGAEYRICTVIVRKHTWNGVIGRVSWCLSVAICQLESRDCVRGISTDLHHPPMDFICCSHSLENLQERLRAAYQFLVTFFFGYKMPPARRREEYDRTMWMGQNDLWVHLFRRWAVCEATTRVSNRRWCFAFTLSGAIRKAIAEFPLHGNQIRIK